MAGRYSAANDPILNGLRGLSEGVGEYQLNKQRALENALKQRQVGLQEQEYKDKMQDVNLSPALVQSMPQEEQQAIGQYQQQDYQKQMGPEFQGPVPDSGLKTSMPRKEFEDLSTVINQKRQNDLLQTQMLRQQSQDKLNDAHIRAFISQANKNNRYGSDMDPMQRRLDFNAHKSIVEAVKKDKVLNQQLGSYQNLGNGLEILANATTVPPGQLAEAQQMIRNGMGLQGKSGVGEREETYIKTLGLNSANVKQFLTGNLEDLRKDKKNLAIIKHIQDLARIERENVRGNVQRRLDTITDGYGDVYERRPEYKKNLDSLLKNTTKQFGKLDVDEELGGGDVDAQIAKLEQDAKDAIAQNADPGQVNAALRQEKAKLLKGKKN